MKKFLWAVLVSLFAVATSHAAIVIFDDDFSVAGNLNGQSPDVGGNWSVPVGSLTVSGGSVDTFNGSTSAKNAYAAFDQSLGAGETLTMTFQTLNTAGDFATDGWVGLSLYTGGSSGTEQFFLGSPGEVLGWGADGDQISKGAVVPARTTEATTGVFTYEYDTGDWTFSVAGGSRSGTADANLALNTIRIGADVNNNASMNISDIHIESNTQTVPEPGTMALMGVALSCLLLVRRMRGVIS